ncbi:MAG TPA: hypothetical protein VFM33_12875 [Aquabacterium sp.]|nr:hypothetical protein [Aquabacterium sp.]
MNTLTDDQRRRHAEFNALFARMPGRNNTERLRNVCVAADVKPGTVRQWRMTNPHRVPSEQVLKLMRLAIGA